MGVVHVGKIRFLFSLLKRSFLKSWETDSKCVIHFPFSVLAPDKVIHSSMLDPDVPKSQGGAVAHQIKLPCVPIKEEHAEILVECGDRWIKLFD